MLIDCIQADQSYRNEPKPRSPRHPWHSTTPLRLWRKQRPVGKCSGEMNGSIFAWDSSPLQFSQPAFASSTTEVALSNCQGCEAIFGLVIPVALVSLYAIYQHVLIKRLRRQLEDKQDHSQSLAKFGDGGQLTGLQPEICRTATRSECPVLLERTPSRRCRVD